MWLGRKLVQQLTFVTGQERALERAAAFGLAHVLYAKSPGGVLAAAERSARAFLAASALAPGAAAHVGSDDGRPAADTIEEPLASEAGQHRVALLE